MLWPAVDKLVELLGKRPENEAEFVEAQFFRFAGIEVNHVVVLNPSYACEISEVL